MIPPDLDPAERAALHCELNIPVDRPAVVLAGQVVAIEGIWDYIEAAKMLVDSDSMIISDSWVSGRTRPR